jgi:hypothetical protein
MKSEDNSNLEIKRNIINSSFISNGNDSDYRNKYKGNLRPEVIQKLVLFGLKIDQIIATHRIYKFTEVEEALNLMMRDPDTNLYNHKFIPMDSNLNKIKVTHNNSKSNEDTENFGLESFKCKICNENYSDHLINDLPILEEDYLSIDKKDTKDKNKENEDLDEERDMDFDMDALNKYNDNINNSIIRNFSFDRTTNKERRNSLKPINQKTYYKNLIGNNSNITIKNTKTERLNKRKSELKIDSFSIIDNSNSKILGNKSKEKNNPLVYNKPKRKSTSKNKSNLTEENKIKLINMKACKTYKVAEELIELFNNPDICKICYDNKISENNKSTFHCGHFFCCMCVTKYLTTNIVDGKVKEYK